MPSQRTLKRLLTLHSWAGIVTGLLLFIVCFSGAVVVFKNEIDLWANPSLAQLPRVQIPASLDTVLAQLQSRYPGVTVETIALLIGRKRLSSSGSAGRPSTQEMLDFCGEHGIVADVEVLPSREIATALARLADNDVRYRFVLDLADL